MRQIEFRIPDGRMAFGDVPEHIDARLQEAVKARLAGDLEASESLLWEAHHLGPKVLPVFYALYKFYFNQRRLDQAERVALIALDAAAHVGGFDPDWRSLSPGAADWASVTGASHFYLFTLKALSFITLRGGRTGESLAMLAKLKELDPADTVGYGVIATLAERVAGGE